MFFSFQVVKRPNYQTNKKIFTMAKIIMIVAIAIVALSANMESVKADGCELNLEQKICMSISVGLTLLQTASCSHQSECEANFKKVNDLARGACGVALTFLCDKETCPGNFNKSACKAQRNLDLRK
jgi:hypothetical protein